MALGWAAGTAAAEAHIASVRARSAYASARACRDCGAVDSVGFAREGRMHHELYELALARWCALDALVRVYDDVGGAE